MLMKTEAGPKAGSGEVLIHGTRVGVYIVARLSGGWQYVGQEGSGTLVGTHNPQLEEDGVYNVLSDDAELTNKESTGYKNSGPVLIATNESFWQPLNDRELVEVRRIVLPELSQP